MNDIPISIELTMTPPDGPPPVEIKTRMVYLPTFIVTADASMEGEMTLSYKVETFGVGNTLNDIKQLGNAFEVLGHQLIANAEKLYTVRKPVDD